MTKDFAVFSPEVAQQILDKLGISGGFDRQKPINPKRLLQKENEGDKSTQLYENKSGETIPPYGCMKVSGSVFSSAVGADIISVVKPNSERGLFVFNGQYSVADGNIASCYTGKVRAAIDKEFAGDTSQRIWGPLDDWYVRPDGLPAIQRYGDSQRAGDNDGNEELLLGQTFEGKGDTFVVGMVEVGGERGSAESQCSFRYNITDPFDEDSILLADVNPSESPHVWRRINIGAYSPATIGIAAYSDFGLFIIYCNEVPIAGTC